METRTNSIHLRLDQIRKDMLKEQHGITRIRLLKNTKLLVGTFMILTVVLIAVFAPLITAQSPYDQNISVRLTAPCAEYLFGTDTIGRDMFSRVIYGCRISLLVGCAVGLFSGLLGLSLGLYATSNPVADHVLMCACDALKAIPSILLAISLMTIAGGSLRNVLISLTVVNTPTVARIVRSSAMTVREQTFIEAIRAQGAGMTRILWKHIAPNILSPLLVQITAIFASAIIAEASLSFLGAGVPAPEPSLGSILNESKAVIYTAWWMVLYPSIALAWTVLGLNLFGDGLRDFLDPKTK